MTEVIVGIISRTVNFVEEYLLISATKDFGEYTGCYYPPGGHIEKGEDKKTALKREIKEELNLEIEAIKELAKTKGDIEGQITYWWLCEVTGGKIKIDISEIEKANYFSKEEIKKLPLWPATQKFFENYVF